MVLSSLHIKSLILYLLSCLRFFPFCCCMFIIIGPIVKGAAPVPPDREHGSGLESPKKRTSKILPSFKIPAFKKTKGTEKDYV